MLWSVSFFFDPTFFIIDSSFGMDKDSLFYDVQLARIKIEFRDYVEKMDIVVPFPVTVTTTKIITFSVGDPYKPFCTTVTGRGPHQRYVSYPLIAKLWTFDMLGHGTAAGTCWQNYEAYLGAAKLIKCWRDIL